MPSLDDFYPDPAHIGRTLFSVTDDELIVQKLV